MDQSKKSIVLVWSSSDETEKKSVGSSSSSVCCWWDGWIRLVASYNRYLRVQDENSDFDFSFFQIFVRLSVRHRIWASSHARITRAQTFLRGSGSRDGNSPWFHLTRLVRLDVSVRDAKPLGMAFEKWRLLWRYDGRTSCLRLKVQADGLIYEGSTGNRDKIRKKERGDAQKSRQLLSSLRTPSCRSLF